MGRDLERKNAFDALENRILQGTLVDNVKTLRAYYGLYKYALRPSQYASVDQGVLTLFHLCAIQVAERAPLLAAEILSNTFAFDEGFSHGIAIKDKATNKKRALPVLIAAATKILNNEGVPRNVKREDLQNTALTYALQALNHSDDNSELSRQAKAVIKQLAENDSVALSVRIKAAIYGLDIEGLKQSSRKTLLDIGAENPFEVITELGSREFSGDRSRLKSGYVDIRRRIAHDTATESAEDNPLTALEVINLIKGDWAFRRQAIPFMRIAENIANLRTQSISKEEHDIAIKAAGTALAHVNDGRRKAIFSLLHAIAAPLDEKQANAKWVILRTINNMRMQNVLDFIQRISTDDRIKEDIKFDIILFAAELAKEYGVAIPHGAFAALSKGVESEGKSQYFQDHSLLAIKLAGEGHDVKDSLLFAATMSRKESVGAIQNIIRIANAQEPPVEVADKRVFELLHKLIAANWDEDPKMVAKMIELGASYKAEPEVAKTFQNLQQQAEAATGHMGQRMDYLLEVLSRPHLQP